MKEHKKHHYPDCTTTTCDWGVYQAEGENSVPYLGCVPGSGDCMPFNLLEADPDDSRSDPLIEAVKQMKAIANALTPPGDKYKLSLVNLKPEKFGAEAGLVLAWVWHGENPPPGAEHNVVNGKSSPEAIAQALGLKRESQEK